MTYLTRILVLTFMTLVCTACGDSAVTVMTTDRTMTFEPADLTIAVGDTVEFVMTSTHNAVEVSKEIFDNGGVTALDGGFLVNFGETKKVTFNKAGVHYYVCQPHVTVAMIGTITVE